VVCRTGYAAWIDLLLVLGPRLTRADNGFLSLGQMGRICSMSGESDGGDEFNVVSGKVGDALVRNGHTR
jgi:hypothetical protein